MIFQRFWEKRFWERGLLEKHPPFWLLLALALFLPLSSAWGERKTTADKRMKLTVNSDWIANKYGYMPFRFSVNHWGPRETYRFAIHYDDYRKSCEVSKKVTLERGSQVQFTLNVPQLGNTRDWNIKVYDSSGTLLETLGQYHSSLVNTFEEKEVGILAIQKSEPDFRGWNKYQEKEERTLGSYSSGYHDIRQLWIHPGQLPPTWISYSGIGAVVIPLEEFFSLPSASQRAIIQWVGQGGRLCLSGVEGQQYILPRLKTLFPHLFFGTGLSISKAFWHFGKIIFLQSKKPFEETIPSLRILAEENETDNRLFCDPGPIWKKLDRPRTGFCLLLLLLFSFVVLPMTFSTLKKKGKLILIYLIVPLLSLLLTGFIFVFSFFSEGITPKSEVYSLCLLDQEQNMVYGKTAFQIYAPLSPGPLKFHPQTAVFFSRLAPIPISGGRGYSRYTRNRDNLSLRWEDEEILDRGWVVPRETAYVATIYIKSSRRRILLKKKGAKLSLVNSLGTSIVRLGYVGRGKYYLLEQRMEKGGRGTLKEVSRDEFFDEFAPANFNLPSFKHLQAGTYLAEVDTWPENEMGLSSFKIKKQQHFLLGRNAFPK